MEFKPVYMKLKYDVFGHRAGDIIEVASKAQYAKLAGAGAIVCEKPHIIVEEKKEQKKPSRARKAKVESKEEETKKED